MTEQPPIVDAWAQHPTTEFIQHPMFASIRRWVGMDGEAEGLDLELTAQLMRNAGVERALLSAWWGPDGPLIDNHEVHALVEAHPDLFAGVGSVDLSRPAEAARQVRRCVDELSFVGIRVLPWLWELPPDDRRYYPVYAACVEADVPVCLQVGHTGPMKPSGPGRPIPHLDRVALDFPDLTIVGGHIGHPWTEEMVALATKYENVYIDTSAYKPTRYPDELVDYLSGHGSEKVLWGTNYPMLMPEDGLEGLDELGLDPGTRRRFLGENAAEVFGLDLD